MSNSIFERYEIKYLVSDKQRRYITQMLKEHMEPDEYGESTVCNVYYDTPDFLLIRRSLEKTVYKEKLRIRSYGPASPDDKIFVELKKKYDGIVYKRRIAVEEREAEAFLKRERPLKAQYQIGRELEYFLKLYGNLRPAVHLSYDRSAYYAKDDPNLRLTFDRNIRYRTTNLLLTARPGGELILPQGQSLMEIKVGGAMPLWLVDLLNREKIYPTSFSKYGRAYCSIVRNNSVETRGIICA